MAGQRRFVVVGLLELFLNELKILSFMLILVMQVRRVQQ